MIYRGKAFVCSANTDKNKECKNAIAVVGMWSGHPNGEFEITLTDLETIKANFDNQKTELVIDYEHQTLGGVQAPAAGWIKRLEIESDKLIAYHTLTPKASEYVKNSEYRYVSPVFMLDSIDPISGLNIGITLHSVALTNKPFIDNIGEIIANKNQNQAKDTKVDKNMEALVKENEQLKKDIETKDKEILTLKEQLATSKVETAIIENKLSASQKDWALKYCKQDIKGFDDFLASIATQKDVPKNNMYANKAGEAGNAKDDTDYVNLMLGKDNATK